MPKYEAWTSSDVVLPDQWGRGWGLRGYSRFDPYRLLRIALLESAVKELVLPHQYRRHCLGCDVVLWMSGSTGVHSISFVDVCASLELSPSGLQRALQTRILPHRTRSFTIHFPTLGCEPDACRAVSQGHQ
jgi:hypothetical protein